MLNNTDAKLVSFPKINLLNKYVSELIAAGEVVDRPASLVKELVENSIDAGSNLVTIEIMNGGISFIRVSDNGCGISHSEIPTAFLRHATSKVLTEEDLDSIATMGFRGEALASIAAVAKVEMMSKVKDDPFGSSYKIEGGSEISHTECGCPDGTTIIIRDLFYNTPARLKFLKKDVSEGNAIQSIVEKLAIIYPEISFRFLRDNKPTKITSGDGKMYSAIYSIFGKQFAASLIPIDYSQSGIKITGFVSSPLFGRGNRTMQYFYVNRRYIKSTSCMAAVEEASRGSLMVGKFPACVINIELNYSLVDVNVHPAKTEVRFSDETKIFDSIYFAVKNAILNSDNKKEVFLTEKNDNAGRECIGISSKSNGTVGFASSVKVLERIPPIYVPKTDGYDRRVEFDDNSHSNKNIMKKTSTDENTTENYSFINERSFEKNETVQVSFIDEEENEQLTVVGELFKTYILCQLKDEFIIIDKHAADERIRYNKLKKDFQTSSQLLAESIFVELDRNYLDALNSSRDLLLEIGFDIIANTDYKAEIAAMPSILINEDIPKIIATLAELLTNKGTDPKIIFDEILHTVACKSAIKANDNNNILDLTVLANEVWKNKNIRFCPHGRPIVLALKKNEIEKMFGRV